MPSWGSILGRLGGKLGGSAVSNTVGYATGSAASAAITPEVQPFANAAWARNPSIPLSPADAAQMVVQNIIEETRASDEAAQSGINADRLHLLIRLAGDPPGPETLLEMWDRGIIDRARAEEGLLQSRLKPEWTDEYLQMARTLLTAEALAEMVVQGVTDEATATEEAKKVSIEPEDFRRMVLVAGSPPGPQELLSMWNRGIADENDVEKGLRQSRLKPEWVPQFKELKKQILSPALAADLVLKQRIPYEKGLRIAEQSGIEKEDFDLMVNVNGRPIGILQAIALARRGEFTEAQFNEVVARSDVRTEYTDDLWKLRIAIPRFGSVLRLVADGTISDDRAVELIMATGYERDIAAGLVASAHKTKHSKSRDLAASMIDVLYESGLESQQWAMEALTALGYDEEEAAQYLMVLDARRLLAAANANLNLIHRMYVNHKYDRETATHHLDAMEIQPEVRNQLLETWTHERDANVARLTNAQIGSALKKGVIDEGDAISRWIQNGYPPEDAQILAQIAQSTGHPSSPTAP